MPLIPQLLCFLGLVVLGTASPSYSKLKLERGSCPDHWSSFNGLCYKYVPLDLSWHNAELNCQLDGAHLASVHSAEEHDFLLTLIKDGNSPKILTWIGLNDLYVEDKWKWSDCTDVDYTMWYSAQPNAGRDGNCVFTNCARQWCDDSCSLPLPSVCVLRT